MARHLRPALLLTLAAAVAAVAIAIPSADAARGAKLVVVAVTDPPDRPPSGDGWLTTVTVANEGGKRSKATTVRFYLAAGRALDAEDLKRVLPASARLPKVAPGRLASRRVTLAVPAGTPDGEFSLVTCVGRGRVGTPGNCHFSAQRLRIGEATVGPPGPPGPPGAPGEPGRDGQPGGSGPPGPGFDVVRLERKVLPLGTATNVGHLPGIGDNEGSTEQFDLAEVGGVRIRALCVSKTNGDGDLPGFDQDADGFLGVDNDFAFDGDGDEAKILLYLIRPDGTMSFAGPHGKRSNINPGFGLTRTSLEAPEKDTGGEGKHMALATTADPEARIEGDADDGNAGVGGDGSFDPNDDDETAIHHGSVFVGTSEGTEFVLDAYVGIGIFGASREQCVFGGNVTVLAK